MKQSLSKTRSVIQSTLFGSSNQVDDGLEKIDEDFFDELEEVLITADFGVKTSTEIVQQLRGVIKQKKLKFKNEAMFQLVEIVTEILSFGGDLQKGSFFLQEPSTILVFGVNGVGKTTTIAKLAHFLINENKSVVVAAADTFRAAAVSQLEIWASRVGCKIVSHGQDCDPASVVFDAVSFAKNNNVNYVICDTAGRLHNKKNLMMQLQKIVRVAKKEMPDGLKSLLVVDATMGQNSLNQVEEFQKVVPLDGIVLTKLDGTAKGGIAVAIAAEKRVPLRFLGVGEKEADLQEFDAKSFAEAIFD